MVTGAHLQPASDTLFDPPPAVCAASAPMTVPPAVGVTLAAFCGLALVLGIALWGAPPEYRAAIIGAVGGLFESIGRAIRSVRPTPWNARTADQHNDQRDVQRDDHQQDNDQQDNDRHDDDREL